MILTIAAIVMLVGLLMYVLSEKPKLVHIGEIMFTVGLLCVLLNVSEALRVLPIGR
jgi:hypothetical protein